MKKILLMLALMLPCLGAWAQNATTHENGVYKIFWEWNGRGYLTYHADYPNDPQLAGVTLSGYQNSHYALTDAGIQLSWYLYTSPQTGKTYLFEATTGKFITINTGVNVGNGKKCTLSTEVTAQAQLDLKATTNTAGYMLSYNNYNFCSGCGSAKGQNPVRFATDGQSDGGIPFVFVSEGASITDEVKDAAITKIQDFEAAEELAERERVMTEIRGLIEQTRPLWNDEKAYYGFGYEAYELFLALDYAVTYDKGRVEDLKTNIAEFRRLLTLSGVKKFLRIKAVADWNDDAPYLGAKNTTVNGKTTRAEYVAEADKNTIFYYDGSSLLSYGSGNYLVSNSDFLGYNGVQSGGSTVGFKLASNGLSGAYNITFNGGGRYLYVNTDNYTDAGNGTNNTNGYCFNLEFVTEIPVTISAAKFASFYAPVAVTLPEGANVKAYYITGSYEVNGTTYATLTEVGNVIPANTGVLLYSETPATYNLTIGGEATANENNWLTGTAASTYISDEAYVLGLADNKIGLYLAEKNQQGNTTWINNGFKAYLPASKVSTSANTLRFSFGGETTAIESVVNNGADANAPIYDLSGRRVANAVKGGIYIQNGKKVYIK